jgi:hypothetical protein
MKNFYFPWRVLLLLALLVISRFAVRAQNVSIGAIAPGQKLEEGQPNFSSTGSIRFPDNMLPG